MKKSSSAISGLQATIEASTRRFGGDLDLSDDEEQIWYSPPPKKSKSDIGPSTSKEDEIFHKFSSDMPEELEGTKPPTDEEEKAHFPEFDYNNEPLIPPELQLDIKNAGEYSFQHVKPLIEDYCSSSSEFEIDDDSSEDFEEPDASLSPYSMNISSISDSITETCPSSSSATPSTPVALNSPIPAPKPFALSSASPKNQAAITNYFGVRQSDGSFSKTTKVVIPNYPVFGKKQSSTTASSPKPAAPTLPLADSWVETKEKAWSREPKEKENCPFYKRLAGTTFIVDDFRFAYKTPVTKSFFLTHFHSDHYQGLNSKFNRGIIYCSPITGSLTKSHLKVPGEYIKMIPLRTPFYLEDVEVTFFDANHCPGAVVILFRLRDGTLHLHTGDFRFDSDLPDHLHLLSLSQKISNLYLDTTYADPKYTFPHQQLVSSKVLDLVAPYAKDPKTLLIVGTYTIGKERIFLSLAERFGLKFWAKPSKINTLKHLEIDLILQELATKDPLEARLHILPLFDLSLKKLEAYLDANPSWSRIIAIRPTGWAYSSPKKTKTPASPSVVPAFSKSPSSRKVSQPNDGFSTHSTRRGAITVHSAPYSEHSSFSELCTFVRALKPRWIIPTVNNRSRESVTEMVKNLRG